MKLILKHNDFKKNKITLEIDKEKHFTLKYNNEIVKNDNGRSTVKDDFGNKRKLTIDFKNIDLLIDGKEKGKLYESFVSTTYLITFPMIVLIFLLIIFCLKIDLPEGIIASIFPLLNIYLIKKIFNSQKNKKFKITSSIMLSIFMVSLMYITFMAVFILIYPLS